MKKMEDTRMLKCPPQSRSRLILVVAAVLIALLVVARLLLDSDTMPTTPVAPHSKVSVEPTDEAASALEVANQGAVSEAKEEGENPAKLALVEGELPESVRDRLKKTGESSSAFWKLQAELEAQQLHFRTLQSYNLYQLLGEASSDDAYRILIPASTARRLGDEVRTSVIRALDSFLSDFRGLVEAEYTARGAADIPEAQSYSEGSEHTKLRQLIWDSIEAKFSGMTSFHEHKLAELLGASADKGGYLKWPPSGSILHN